MSGNLPENRAGPLEWRPGSGWLVLVAGRHDGAVEWDETDALVLARAVAGRPTAAVAAAPGSTEEAAAVLDRWAELGGNSGYIVKARSAREARDSEAAQLLLDAGLIYVADATSAFAVVRALSESPALCAMGRAFEDGTPVVAAGAAAAALGTWVGEPAEPAREEHGLKWVQNAIVAPRFEGAEQADWLRRLLAIHPDCLGLGIPEGAALALGAGGEVKSLGRRQVTVVVNQNRASQ